MAGGGGDALVRSQHLSLLEVVHAAIGITSSPPLLVFCQIYSRIMVASLIPLVQIGPAEAVLTVAWSTADLIRNLYYLVRGTGMNAPLLTWARYSMFLVLYPLGIAAELMIITQSLPSVRGAEGAALADEVGLWLPKLTVRAAGSNAFAAFAAVYVVIFPLLFGHMLAARKKHQLAGKSKSKSKRD